MSQTVAVVSNLQIGGIPFNLSETLTGDEVESVVTEVPVAWGGTLSTRTDNDTGTLTMDDAGHLISTGDLVDLYWDGGTRRRVVVGTVSGTSVPFGAVTAGAGDNLPVATTAIVMCEVVKRQMPATIADIQGIAMKCDFESQFHFMEDATTEAWNKHIDPSQAGLETSAAWYGSMGATPITGTVLIEVWMSHADVDATHVMSSALISV